MLILKSQIRLKYFINAYEDYEKYIRVRNYRGMQKYFFAVLEHILWLEQQGISHMTEVDQIIFQKYFTYLVTRPNQRQKGLLSDSSIKNHLFALSLFYENLLQSMELSKTISIPKYHIKQKKEQEVISRDEINQLLGVSENLLEKCIIAVGYGCGLRRSEMEKLNVQDIFLSKGILVVRYGKNSKRREIPLSDSIIIILKEYITAERPKYLNRSKPEEAFYLNSEGRRMAGNYLNKRLVKMVGQTQNSALIQKNITLHNLRHSITTHLMENGAGFEHVREFLGHSEIDTTQLYAIRRKQNRVLSI